MWLYFLACCYTWLAITVKVSIIKQEVVNMFNKIKIVAKKAALTGSALAGSAGMAMADAWSPTVALDTSPILTVAGVILTAIGGIWAVQKVIALVKSR